MCGLLGLVHLCGSTLYSRPSAAAETLHAGADAGGCQTQTDAVADATGTTASKQTASAAAYWRVSTFTSCVSSSQHCMNMWLKMMWFYVCFMWCLHQDCVKTISAASWETWDGQEVPKGTWSTSEWFNVLSLCRRLSKNCLIYVWWICWKITIWTALCLNIKMVKETVITRMNTDSWGRNSLLKHLFI